MIPSTDLQTTWCCKKKKQICKEHQTTNEVGGNNRTTKPTTEVDQRLRAMPTFLSRILFSFWCTHYWQRRRKRKKQKVKKVVVLCGLRAQVASEKKESEEM
jgi:mitochondrial fission protein ELM1